MEDRLSISLGAWRRQRCLSNSLGDGRGESAVRGGTVCGVGGVGTGLRERMCGLPENGFQRFYKFTECAWSHLFSASSVCTLSPPFTASFLKALGGEPGPYLWIPLHKTLVPGGPKQPEDTTSPSHSASMRTPGGQHSGLATLTGVFTQPAC